MSESTTTRINTSGSGPAITAATQGEHRLRHYLRLNAGFSTLTGFIAAIGADPMASFLDLDQVWLVRLVGIGLLAFAVQLLIVARQRPAVLQGAAPAISIGDFAWVLGTVVVVAAGWLSSEGAVVMAGIAVVVLALGIGQLDGWRRMTGRS